MERGGYKTGGGGRREDLPLWKGGAENLLAMLTGGGATTIFEVVLTRELEVLAIEMRGHKKFPHFKRGANKVVSCLEGGGAKSFGPTIFPFCSPPFPIINDQSLSAQGQYVTRCDWWVF